MPTILKRKDSDIFQEGVFKSSKVTDNLKKKKPIRFRINKNMVKKTLDEAQKLSY